MDDSDKIGTNTASPNFLAVLNLSLSMSKYYKLFLISYTNLHLHYFKSNSTSTLDFWSLSDLVVQTILIVSSNLQNHCSFIFVRRISEYILIRLPVSHIIELLKLYSSIRLIYGVLCRRVFLDIWFYLWSFTNLKILFYICISYLW